MNVTRDTAVALLVGTGRKNAKSLNDAKLLGALQGLPDKLDDESVEEAQEAIEDKGALKLLKAIVKDPSILEDVVIAAESNGSPKAAKKGKKEVELEPEEDEDEDEADEAEEGDDDEEEEESDEDEGDEEADEEDEEEAPKAKKGKKEKKPAKKAAAKKSAAEKDRFGSRLGSASSKINAVMSKKAQSVEELAKASKCEPARIRAHVRYLVEKGHITHVEGKGYKIA